jgi:hypothetical protein
MKKHISIFTALLFSVAVFAQGNSILSMSNNGLQPFNMQAIKSNNVKFTISRNGNDLNVMAKAASARECDSLICCCIKGKLIFTGNTRNDFGQLVITPGKTATNLN